VQEVEDRTDGARVRIEFTADGDATEEPVCAAELVTLAVS
jgi:hypothetical protein